MKSFILTVANFVPLPPGTIVPPPPDSQKRCYEIDYLKGFLTDPLSQGVKIKISKLGIRGKFRRNPKEYYGRVPNKDEFVISRDVIETLFTGFKSIDFYIVTDPPADEIYLIIERSHDKCGDNGPGGDGVKISIPV